MITRLEIIRDLNSSKREFFSSEMLAASNRRFSTSPQEESVETVQELITTFVENLKLQGDQNVIQTILHCNKQVAEQRETALELLQNQIQGLCF